MNNGFDAQAHALSNVPNAIPPAVSIAIWRLTLEHLFHPSRFIQP